MKRSVRYILERVYPYAVASFLVVIIYMQKINYISSNNINNAIDGVITITSLIIGFVGAVLPVIMGMKNDSKFVRYVFEKDTERLFMKYMKNTLLYGMLLIAISVSLYFKKDYETTIYYKYVFYVWIFMMALFLSATHRCINNMLNLIFSKDEELFEQFEKESMTENEMRIREKLINQNEAKDNDVKNK